MRAHQMSHRGKTAAVLLLGVLIGGVAAFLFMGYQTRRVMAIYAEAALLEAATDARQLTAGRSHAVLDRKNAALGNMVLGFEAEHARYLRQDRKVATLWVVQRYYDECPSSSPSPEVKAILDDLPPRPPTSCTLKNRKPKPEPEGIPASQP